MTADDGFGFEEDYSDDVTQLSTVTGVFCLNCNNIVVPNSDMGNCPHCHQVIEIIVSASDAEALKDVDEVPPDADRTIESRHPNLLAKQLSSSSSEGDFEKQLGRSLHIYEFQSLLGKGGMGRVYLARHSHLHRRCAVKVLSPSRVMEEVDYVARFLDEGRTSAELLHPNIVTTHAIGEERGYHFLEMEYVGGGSLKHLLNEEGRLTPQRATTIAARIAHALGHAHRNRILHRDVKPDNILITFTGVPKLTDFGLAKRVRDERQRQDPFLVGTPAFMAPELFSGAPNSPATDVYALGVSYFVLLTGRPPFTGKTLGELRSRVVSGPVPNIRELAPDVPLEIAECVYRLMDRAADNRPQTGLDAFHLISASAGQSRDLDSLLREAFENSFSVKWSRVDLEYRIDVRLPNGRGQSVYLEPSPAEAGERLLTIFSPCCDAEPQYFHEALKLNSEIPHGALAIRTIEGREMFCMIDNYPRATIDAEELRRSAMEVAQRADAVEKVLTGDDIY
ncbi:serine/threonine protein kinase [Stratiformator vulcanicus]|uniref:Serine/threonine-protein kinase PrkC n=1 Tax=Stratiformator vulcanicus TaxID=2527980 RepID=A0A517R0D5_9PLAN|nr:serine/threonine-protein kinase [Stratiformator vulcanicus]QDT37293.1 Serine/threonine-protein kinase PrkC [Stratiformator vulcanicus]